MCVCMCVRACVCVCVCVCHPPLGDPLPTPRGSRGGALSAPFLAGKGIAASRRSPAALFVFSTGGFLRPGQPGAVSSMSLTPCLPLGHGPEGSFPLS